MWKRSYSKEFIGVDKKKVWNLWSDVKNWPRWDPDIQFCDIKGTFKEGNSFTLKPKGGPKVKIKLVEVIPGVTFTDCTSFPGAKMYGKHVIEETKNGLKLTTTMTIQGPLGFIWRKVVAEGIVKNMPQQLEGLVELARR
jgi:hypothetical protein